jgi:hypothetical protein
MSIAMVGLGYVGVVSAAFSRSVATTWPEST